MTHPARCRLGALFGFPLRDSAAARTAGAARTSGCRLSGGATRVRLASGTERRRAAMSSPTTLPVEIRRSAERGELQKVVKWLRKGGAVDAFGSAPTNAGQPSAFTLLQTAGGSGHLAIVRELLKRGASVDLPTSFGITALNDAACFGHTALMGAACHGHLSTLLVLLQHSANPDLQANNGSTALMSAAAGGHESCVKALLRAKANTELLDNGGRTALRWAVGKGHTAIAELIRQHAAPPQPVAAVAPEVTQAEQAAQAARADAAMEEPLAEEAAEQATVQAPSTSSSAIPSSTAASARAACAACSACVACGATTAAGCGGAACCRMSSAMVVWPLTSARFRAVWIFTSNSSVLALARSSACTHAICPL